MKNNAAQEIQEEVKTTNVVELNPVANTTNDTLIQSFVNRFGLTDSKKAVNVLKQSFFKDVIAKGHCLTQADFYNVISVSMESKLNPFNNELYPVLTDFGFVKILATVDGWMKIGHSHDIVNISYLHSEEKVEVTTLGGRFKVCEYIECTVEHKTRGKATAREYILESCNETTRMNASWTLPSRNLRHTSLIQAFRMILSVSGIADEDIINSINLMDQQVLETAQSRANKIVVSEINEDDTEVTQEPSEAVVTEDVKGSESIAVSVVEDDTEVTQESSEAVVTEDVKGSESIAVSVVEDDTEVTQESSEAVVTEDVKGSESIAVSVIEDDTEVTQESSEAVVTEDVKGSESIAVSVVEDGPEVNLLRDEMDDDEIDEFEASPSVVSMVKQMIFRIKLKEEGYTVDSLKLYASKISDEITIQWVEQEINKL